MAISRQAILIGAPSVKPPLPGVTIDMRDIKRFLLSSKGGAWRADEIVTLSDPNAASVYAQIEAARYKDYVFISCSGHGEHRVGKSLDETVMYVKENETVSINRINPKNKRHLVIVDVCRNLVKIEKMEEVRAAMEAFMKSAAIPIDYRKIFDDAVMSNPEGRIVAYSCDINQSAGDDGNGGVFTQELLASPKYFSPTNNNRYGIVKIDQAFERAQKMTYAKNAPQKPIFNAGRRMDFYPFAIV